MTYEIKKGISKPEARGRGTQYPFSAMEVGDCFEAPNDMGSTKRRNTISSCAWSYARKDGTGKSFSTRVSKDKTMVVCWRDK
jgi:hypothetical protein